tara:strand:+ start:537 stop:743 length:207 start_codon:yes stop_codon:yes gene_type:complete
MSDITVNQITAAMDLGASLRKEQYEELVEDLYIAVENRLNSNPDFVTEEITECLRLIGQMLESIRLED